MSRELLKRAASIIHGFDDSNSILAEIDQELAKPDPERIVDFSLIYDFSERHHLNYNELCSLLNNAYKSPPPNKPEPELLSDDELKKIITRGDIPYYLKNNILIGYRAIESASINKNKHLYTSPPPRKPLSDYEVELMLASRGAPSTDGLFDFEDSIQYEKLFKYDLALVRLTEKAHGIGDL